MITEFYIREEARKLERELFIVEKDIYSLEDLVDRGFASARARRDLGELHARRDRIKLRLGEIYVQIYRRV